MKIDFPKLIREIDLSEYAPEIKGKVQVWVNPPTKTLTELGDEFDKIVKSEEPDIAPFLAIMSDLLSQGKDKWTQEELTQLIEGTRETDPAFWSWLQGKVLDLIREHRTGLKKDLAPPAQS